MQGMGLLKGGQCPEQAVFSSVGWSQISCMILFSEPCKVGMYDSDGDVTTLLLKCHLTKSTTSLVIM